MGYDQHFVCQPGTTDMALKSLQNWRHFLLDVRASEVGLLYFVGSVIPNTAVALS